MARLLTDKEVRTRQLDMMDFFHQFCHKHNIHYSLSCGSLIGAYRHKGFIPWDDDIDVYMLREEYKRLQKAFTEYKPDRYVLKSLETDSDYSLPFAKLTDTQTIFIDEYSHNDHVGVNMDIFPIDYVCPSTFAEQRKFQRRLLHYLQIRRRSWKSLNTIKTIKGRLHYLLLKLVITPIPARAIAQKISKNAQKNNKKCHEYLFENVQGFIMKGYFDAADMADYTEVEFEGRKYDAMVGGDHFLRVSYGDYMQLPPEEKRKTHHAGGEYWEI